MRAFGPTNKVGAPTRALQIRATAGQLTPPFQDPSNEPNVRCCIIVGANPAERRACLAGLVCLRAHELLFRFFFRQWRDHMCMCLLQHPSSLLR